MVNLIYSGKYTNVEACQISNDILKETFQEAMAIHKTLLLHNKKIAYFFIDPLLNAFEAANQFYFNIFECKAISKINTYKSGASPIQALADAKELIESGLYDAVFLFGHEPLLTTKRVYGKEAVTKAMSIFDSHTIIQCYNELAHKLCDELELSEDRFMQLSDQLYSNYLRTYTRVTGYEVSKLRGRALDELHADLFKLTDCANPNIDFSGGLILANDESATLLQISPKDRITVSGVSYAMVAGSPEKISEIVGTKDNIFPHLRTAFQQAEQQSNIKVIEHLYNRNLYLESYTCYPPVPIALLLVSGIISSIDELPHFLDQYDITITGGMNLAKAPWNNPALNGMIEMYQKLKKGPVSYGLVHGNGGIGEVQGIAIFERK
ncbi:hypothetical protein ACJ2A9_19285 [Anaerobacillus sp. MEB173]|uniref:hypothetical protein n=1 Tax=Anaerobacillus sp. MEB173 TaxID=3383345 RepID=UPI003F92AC9C